MIGRQTEFTRELLILIVDHLKLNLRFYDCDIDDCRSTATLWLINRDISRETILSLIRNFFEKNWNPTIIEQVQARFSEKLRLSRDNKELTFQTTVYINRDGDIRL